MKELFLNTTYAYLTYSKDGSVNKHYGRLVDIQTNIDKNSEDYKEHGRYLTMLNLNTEVYELIMESDIVEYFDTDDKLLMLGLNMDDAFSNIKRIEEELLLLIEKVDYLEHKNKNLELTLSLLKSKLTYAS